MSTPAPTPARNSARNRHRRALAMTAALTGAGLAAVATLAAWNDNEWVFGGTGPGGAGDPGIGTSTFNVVQKTWEGSTAPLKAAIVADHESNPTANALIFDINPGALTPGTTIYAPVALRTTDTSVAGTLTLQPAVASTNPAHTVADAGAELWDELDYSVRVTNTAATAANCNADDFATAGAAIVTGAGLSDAITPGNQSVMAAGDNVQYYCFALTLPDSPAAQELQGRKVFPAWQFAATSA